MILERNRKKTNEKRERGGWMRMADYAKWDDSTENLKGVERRGGWNKGVLKNKRVRREKKEA